jgi:uracil-DNA glycosylase family 4
MAWTEHQQAVLRAMGLRVWGPAATEAVLAGSEVPADVAASTMPEPQAAHPAPPPALRQAPMPASGAVPDVATLDWPALRAAVADCRACSLCQTRRQTVFGIGSPSAHWMVVGEAPGEHEDRQGEPFVGAAGQLLDRMLAALDLTRDSQGDDPARQVYIANTLKCRPPGNRNPAPEELARCEPFLQRQIALRAAAHHPRDGALRGAVAAAQRCADRQAAWPGAPYQGVPLVVTYHPAYLLRNLPDKAKAWADLCLAAETAGAAPRPV